MSPRILLASAVLALVPASALLARPEPGTSVQPARSTLTIGDPAPALSIEKWVRGDSITSFENGKVYIVEFWATWCVPCIEAIPHLTEVGRAYADKGVTVIGVTRPDKRNSLEKVEAMVKEKNAKGMMTYTIGWDGAEKTYKSFMEAADRNGIPCSFIVDKAGRVAFIGHPSQLDGALDQVLAGTWDMAGAKREFEASRENAAKFGEFLRAIREKDMDRADLLGAELVDRRFRNDAGTLNGIAWKIVDPESDLPRRNLELAQRAAERAAVLTNYNDDGVLDTLAWVHFRKGDVAKAIELEEKVVSMAQGQAKVEAEKTLTKFRDASK